MDQREWNATKINSYRNCYSGGQNFQTHCKERRSDKRRIIVTLAESRIGKILPMHFLYKDTANRLLAAVTFVADFALIYKEKDSSNEKET